MKYKAMIVRIADGVERLCDMGPDIPWNEGSLFWWTDGNYSCDCNRHLTFERAGEKPLDEEMLLNEELDCGHHRYYVPYVLLEDGNKITIDTEQLRP